MNSLLLDELIEERTNALLNKVVRSHINNTLTAQEALNAVAAIASLRGLKDDFLQRLRKSSPDGRDTEHLPR